MISTQHQGGSGSSGCHTNSPSPPEISDYGSVFSATLSHSIFSTAVFSVINQDPCSPNTAVPLIMKCTYSFKGNQMPSNISRFRDLASDWFCQSLADDISFRNMHNRHREQETV